MASLKDEKDNQVKFGVDPINPVVRLEFFTIFALGIVLASILFIVALCGTINQASYVKLISETGGAVKAVEGYFSVTESLWKEAQLRVANPSETAAIAEAHDKWMEEYAVMKKNMYSEIVEQLDILVSQLAAANTQGSILYSFSRLLLGLTIGTYHILRENFESRSRATADSMALFSAQGSYSSLLSRMIYFYSKAPSYEVSANSANGLAFSLVSSLLSSMMATDSLQLDELLAPFVPEGEALFGKIYSFKTTTETIDYTSLASLKRLSAYLLLGATVNLRVTASMKAPLIMFAIGIVLTAGATALCTMVFLRYLRQTEASTSLVRSFESKTEKKFIEEQFFPLMHTLRAVRDPHSFIGDLSRMYSYTASWVDVLRTITPQVLFVDTNASRVQNPESMPWRIVNQKVNLGVQKTITFSYSCVVEVTLMLSPADSTVFTKKKLGEQLEVLNRVMQIVVSEANASGGIMLGTRGNLSFVMMWSAGWLRQNAELPAFQASHRIQRQLRAIPGIPPILIVMATGPMVIGSIIGGERRYACALSTTLSTLESIRTVSQAMGWTMVLDRTTTRRLPRRISRKLRPLLVLRFNTRAGAINCIIHKGDEDEITSDVQRAQYMKCFTLYQNNLFHEALKIYKQYLEDYPNDMTARRMYEFVLLPKFHLSEELTKNKIMRKHDGNPLENQLSGSQ